MRLFVTGGAGYIGSIVATKLVEAGHRVTVFDDLSTGHRDAVPGAAEFVHGDLLDRAALDAALAASRADAVMHFAGKSLVGESTQQPARYFANNVGGAVNLVDAMRAHAVPRIVFSSTAAVYGEPETVPIPETAPPRPTNPYGASKLAVDQLLGFAARAHGLCAISLRYFNVAGAYGQCGERHAVETHLIPLVLAAAAAGRAVDVYGTDYPTPDHTAIRDYVHVSDLADAHLLALAAGAPGEHRIYNLGNSAGHSVRQVIEMARAVTGVPIADVARARRAGDPAILVAASDRARRELGWTPQRSELRVMIEDAWAFMTAERP